jgi:hypothetical protein
MNRLLVDFTAYGTQGLAYGLIMSVFFIKKRRIMGYGFGFGLGTALNKNCS